MHYKRLNPVWLYCKKHSDNNLTSVELPSGTTCFQSTILLRNTAVDRLLNTPKDLKIYSGIKNDGG